MIAKLARVPTEECAWNPLDLNFRQKWFIRKSDVVTRTVGTGYKISVDTLSVSEMRDAIEKNECSMRDHEWKKYSPQIKNWLDGL